MQSKHNSTIYSILHSAISKGGLLYSKIVFRILVDIKVIKIKVQPTIKHKENIGRLGHQDRISHTKN